MLHSQVTTLITGATVTVYMLRVITAILAILLHISTIVQSSLTIIIRSTITRTTKMRHLLTVLFSLICSVSLAAYPYDAVCDITVGRTGGSGTIIAVSETQALVLTCKHVIRRPGRRVMAYWPNVPGGFTSYGRSIDVGDKQDIAAFITQKPPGIRPVRVRLPHVDNGPFTNVGFPSGRGGLEWQQGEFGNLNHSEFHYGVAPVPGMSGGATFDRFGNLVGVIVRYGRSSGVSTSGSEMMEFVNKFRKKSGWQVGK